MPDTPTDQSVTDLSSEHLEQVITGAAEDSVTVKVWLERAIERESRRRLMRSRSTDVQADAGDVVETRTVETSTEVDQTLVAEGDAHEMGLATPRRSHHAASHTSTEKTTKEAFGARLDRDLEVEKGAQTRREAEIPAETVSQSRTETVRRTESEKARPVETHRMNNTRAQTAAETLAAEEALRRERDVHERDMDIEKEAESRRDASRRTETNYSTTINQDVRRDRERLSEISAFHSRMAARSAAAEDIPLTIWLEQAILERTRRREGETVRPPIGPAVVEPQPMTQGAAAPFVSETVVQGRGFELIIALVLGVVLAVVLLLIPVWTGWGRVLFFGDGPNNTNGVIVQPTPPPAPAPISSVTPGGGTVVVTTLVNGEGRSSSRRVWTDHRRTRPRDNNAVILYPDNPPALDPSCNCILKPN